MGPGLAQGYLNFVQQQKQDALLKAQLQGMQNQNQTGALNLAKAQDLYNQQQGDQATFGEDTKKLFGDLFQVGTPPSSDTSKETKEPAKASDTVSPTAATDSGFTAPQPISGPSNWSTDMQSGATTYPLPPPPPVVTQQMPGGQPPNPQQQAMAQQMMQRLMANAQAQGGMSPTPPAQQPMLPPAPPMPAGGGMAQGAALPPYQSPYNAPAAPPPQPMPTALPPPPAQQAQQQETLAKIRTISPFDMFKGYIKQGVDPMKALRYIQYMQPMFTMAQKQDLNDLREQMAVMSYEARMAGIPIRQQMADASTMRAGASVKSSDASMMRAQAAMKKAVADYRV